MKQTLPQKRHYIQSPFKKGKVKCPVCDRTHRYYCSVTVDGSLALCKFVSSKEQAKDGRFIHILNADNDIRTYTLTPAPSREIEVKRANADACHAVYTALLSHLGLESAHGDSLLNERGLSDTTIAYNLYASVPDKSKGDRMARALARFFDLKGVPGFYYQDARWRFNTTYKGFYVPYRDERGRIVGLQIRRDEEAEAKYLWLTSVGKPEGASPGAPLHFVKPDLAESTGGILLTEGALKADRISEFMDAPSVAVAGVTAANPETLISRLRQALPKLKSVTIGFDMDWQSNENVRASLLRLVRELKATALEVKGAKWDMALGKGLDDYLFNSMGRAA